VDYHPGRNLGLINVLANESAADFHLSCECHDRSLFHDQRLLGKVLTIVPYLDPIEASLSEQTIPNPKRKSQDFEWVTR